MGKFISRITRVVYLNSFFIRTKRTLVMFSLFFFTFFLLLFCDQDNSWRSRNITAELNNMKFFFEEKLFIELKEDSIYLFSIQKKSSIPFYKSKYKYSINGDTITFNVSGLFFKIFKENNSLIFVSYKALKQLPKHIDEVLKLDDNQILTNFSNSPININKDIFIIPYNFRGVCVVIYRQNDGVQCEKDKDGNRVFEFPPGSMVLKVKERENVYNIATNNIEFFKKDSLGNLDEIKVISGITQNQANEYCAINLGFNQIERENINEIVGDPISGNILFFFIGKSPHSITHFDSLFYKDKYYALERPNRK